MNRYDELRERTNDPLLITLIDMLEEMDTKITDVRDEIPDVQPDEITSLENAMGALQSDVDYFERRLDTLEGN